MVDIDKISVGASDGGKIILKGDELSFSDKGLKNSWGKNDFQLFLGIFPETIDIHID